MPITSRGLGSGLDVTSIVSQLMNVERLPLQKLEQQETVVKAEISAYGTLKGGLSALQDSLAKLKDVVTFQATRATSSDDDVLTVSSDSDAVPSSYYITVNRAAQLHKLGTAEFASSTTFGGNAGDSLTITVGTESFELDLTGAKSLSEIQQAINGESNKTGVKAGLITGDSGNQTLVLTSGESGFENRIQLSFDGMLDSNTFNFSMLNRDNDNQLLSAESELDASLMVDGVAVTRSSNKISDVVEGLVLNLKKVGTSEVGVDRDSSVARTAVESFIAGYNNIKKQISTFKASGLNGSLLRSIESQLRGVFNTPLTQLGNFSYVSELGVTTNSDTGNLGLDTEKLIAALEDDTSSVLTFFSADNGFAAKIDNILEGFLSPGGTLDSIVKGANNRLNGFERSRQTLELRLETIEKRYFDQFDALDTLMASLTTTSQYLTTQLEAISKISLRNDN